MPTKLRTWTWIHCVLLASLAACGRAPEGWTPVLEESSAPFLRAETERAAAQVDLATDKLATDPEVATLALAEARDALDHLLDYYIPLLEARSRAYNAYRHFRLEEPAHAGAELDQIETILLGVAAGDHGHLEREMEEPLKTVELARAALEGDPSRAGEALETLATRLNFLLLKGGLVVD